MSGVFLVMAFSVLFPVFATVLIGLLVVVLAAMLVGTAILLGEIVGLLVATLTPLRVARIAPALRSWSRKMIA